MSLLNTGSFVLVGSSPLPPVVRFIFAILIRNYDVTALLNVFKTQQCVNFEREIKEHLTIRLTSYFITMLEALNKRILRFILGDY